MVILTAWRTATLSRQKRIPALSRLLRSLRRRSRSEQAEIRAHMAAAEAEFDRLEAEAKSREQTRGR